VSEAPVTPHPGPVIIDLPREALTVLIGAAGSGKSTFAARHFDDASIVSSDRLRALIGRNEADQRRNEAVFAELRGWLDQRLSAGQLAVVDATNVDPMWRSDLIAIARRHGRPSVAIVLDLPPETCIARNVSRARRVRAGIVREQVEQLRRTCDRLDLEGFTASYVLRSTDDVERVTITINQQPMAHQSKSEV
jgi:protein phosphatase